MGVISSYFRKREIARLVKRVERNPSADDYIRLILVYQEDSHRNEALRYAARGVERFPSHTQLKNMHDSMRKHERSLEKDRIRQKIQSFPNPALFARLAEIYRSEGDLKRAVEVCKSGVVNYPKYGGIYVVMAQVCLDAKNPENATKNLEKAIQLEQYNYTALLLLGRQYLQSKRIAEALLKFNTILEIAPGDRTVLDLVQRSREMLAKSDLPGEHTMLPEEEKSAPAEDEPAAPDDLTIKVAPPVPRARITEARRKVEERKKTNLKQFVINDAIAGFTQLDGVRAAVLVDMYGQVIASDMGIDIPDDLAGAMITSIYRTTVQSADYLEVGEFEDGLVEGEHGHIHVFAIDQMILAIFADVQIKQGMLLETIRDFVEALADLKN